MPQNKPVLNINNIQTWLCSSGYFFPTNEIELQRFDILLGVPDPTIIGNAVDPFEIINRTKSIPMNQARLLHMEPEWSDQQMVAFQVSHVPERISRQIRKGKQTD